MALLNEIIRETAENYGLGYKAGPLVAEATRIMFDPKKGGLPGFFDRVNQAGLKELTQSWREDKGAPKPIDGKQLEAILGVAAIADAGKRLGMANARVRTAMAFVIPQLARFLTSNGTIPTAMPANFQAFLESDSAKVNAPAGKPVSRPEVKKSRPFLWWSLGVVFLMLTAVVLGYQLLKNQSRIKQFVSQPHKSAVAETPQPIVPEPESGKPVAELVIRNQDGQFEYSGVVSDIGMKTNVTEQLLTFYGQARLKGGLLIDPQVSVPNWLSRLDRVLPQLNIPGLDVRLEGNTVKLGGWLSPADKESVLNSLKTALGSGFRFAYLRDEPTELAEDSRETVLASLSALPPNYQGQDLVNILNQWVINFPEAVAAFPESDRAIADRVAQLMKTMVQPVIIEISGHTDNHGSAAANHKLSLERANSVRDALKLAGVPPLMVETKGYGGEHPLASNDSPYGQFKNRRIEFRVAQICDETHPCVVAEPVVTPSSEATVPGSESAPSENMGENAKLVPGDSKSGSKSKNRSRKAGTTSDNAAKSRLKTKESGISDTSKLPKPGMTGSGESDKATRSGVPKGGRWIPQITRQPSVKPGTEAKKPETTKQPPKPKQKPAEHRREPAANSAQDLF